MADNIKEIEVPVRDLQYMLGFDAAGKWGKKEPLKPETPANSAKGNTGLVKAPLKADILSGKTTGCLSFTAEGLAQIIDQKIPGDSGILEFGDTVVRSGVASTFMLDGYYTGGWYGAASNYYVAVIRFHAIHVGGGVLAEAVDFLTGKTWVYTAAGWLMTGGSDARVLKKGDAAGGSLAGTYPNPTIKASVNLPGSPTTTTQAEDDVSNKVATTAFVAIANIKVDNKVTSMRVGEALPCIVESSFDFSRVLSLDGSYPAPCYVMAPIDNFSNSSVNIIIPPPKTGVSNISYKAVIDGNPNTLSVRYSGSAADVRVVLTNDPKLYTRFGWTGSETYQNFRNLTNEYPTGLMVDVTVAGPEHALTIAVNYTALVGTPPIIA